MAHTIENRDKLLARIRRLKGQVAALEGLVDGERDCADVLQQIAACRGAINGLMNEVIEGHIRYHVVSPDHHPEPSQTRAADQLIGILKTYLK